MKLVRFGEPGREKPGLLGAGGVLRSLEHVVDDIGGDVLTAAGLARIAALDHDPGNDQPDEAGGCLDGADGPASGTGHMGQKGCRVVCQ